MKHSFPNLLVGWLKLSRPTFHTVGILPFILGTLLSYRLTLSFNLEIFLLGLAAIILIMLSVYHSGEYFDYQGDIISCKQHGNKFAGGSRILPSGQVPPAVALWTSIIAIITAALLGIILQFSYKTGPYTFLLGCLGAVPGFFYSIEPVRLVKRGVGEIFIGFCYGWLPVASAYYIQTGAIAPIINIIWLPIGISIFNVILLNEFPDYEADIATQKKNILYRIGKAKGKLLYIFMAIIASLIMFFSPLLGLPIQIVLFYLPFFFISIYIIIRLLRNTHENHLELEKLCALNIIVNLGTSITFILAYIFE